MGQLKKASESRCGVVGVQCRLSDSRYLVRDVVGSAGPLILRRLGGDLAVFDIPWPTDWFDPADRFPQLPYLGSFESRLSRLRFACDGKEVASSDDWLTNLDEMKSLPPRTSSGQIDPKRLTSFKRYLYVRARAAALIDL